MTVAESLRDKLRYNMMMNHDSIEMSDKIFGFDTPAQRELNSLFRAKAFELAVKHNVDLIFTYVCAFDMKEDIEYLESSKQAYQTTIKETPYENKRRSPNLRYVFSGHLSGSPVS